MIHDNADEVIENIFESLLNRYQTGLETSVRGSNFIFDCFHLFYQKCHNINPNLDGFHIGPIGCIKNQKTTVNVINKKDNKYF